MIVVSLQSNPKTGDLAANAKHLAELVEKALAEIVQAGLQPDKVLFLTPACALPGYGWQALCRVNGFYDRCLAAGSILVKELGETTAGRKIPVEVIISLPGRQGLVFVQITAGQIKLLPCHGNGLLTVGALTIYLPEAEATRPPQVNFAALLDATRPQADCVWLFNPLPFSDGFPTLHEEACRSLATKWQMPLVFSNLIGATDAVVFSGASLVVAQDGQIVARGKSFEEDLVIFEFPPTRSACSQVQSMPFRFEALFRASSLGILDYVRKCGFSGVLVGLSGGMDSALVAALAADALGPENVLAVLMPSPWSSDHSVADAIQLADNLGIAYTIVPIADMMKAFEDGLSPVFARLPALANGAAYDPALDATWENIQARIRGVILMSFANRLGRVVLGTGNKSENAVGYCTLYGDSIGSLDPIGDIYKTDVYAVAAWYNKMRGFEVILQNIFEKAPSAELRPGQTDQDSLPPYEILDAVLRQMLEGGGDPAFLQAPAGSDGEEVIKKVLKLLANSEFKRHQSAPILRLSSCTLGHDWRMPVTALAVPQR